MLLIFFKKNSTEFQTHQLKYALYLQRHISPFNQWMLFYINVMKLFQVKSFYILMFYDAVFL